MIRKQQIWRGLEHVVARVSRAARNVRVGGMNMDVPITDARRVEVVANGLPWFVQLAIDAMIVSSVTRTGLVRPGADTRPTAAVQDATRCKRRQTYPELEVAGCARLVVLGIEVGGCFSTETASFLLLLARHRAAGVPGCRGSPGCSLLLRCEPTRLPCLSPRLLVRPARTGTWAECNNGTIFTSDPSGACCSWSPSGSTLLEPTCIQRYPAGAHIIQEYERQGPT